MQLQKAFSPADFRIRDSFERIRRNQAIKSASYIMRIEEKKASVSLHME